MSLIPAFDHASREIENQKKKLPALPSNLSERKKLFLTSEYQQKVEEVSQNIIAILQQQLFIAEPLVALQGIPDESTPGIFLSTLSKEIYHYHNYDHSYHVLEDSIQVAVADQVDSHTIIKLAIAAVCHDLGYIEDHRYYEQLPEHTRPVFQLLKILPGKYHHNEEIGAQMAENMMMRYNELSGNIYFNETDRQEVWSAIMATELKEIEVKNLEATQILDGQRKFPVQIPPPNHPFAAYLLDGDLGNMWKRDIVISSEPVFQEIRARETIETGVDLGTKKINPTDFEQYVQYVDARLSFSIFSFRLLTAKELYSLFARSVYHHLQLQNEMLQRQQLVFLKKIQQLARIFDDMTKKNKVEQKKELLSLQEEFYKLSKDITKCDPACMKKRMQNAEALGKKLQKISHIAA